jgi:hypothetical protein
MQALVALFTASPAHTSHASVLLYMQMNSVRGGNSSGRALGCCCFSKKWRAFESGYRDVK